MINYKNVAQFFEVVAPVWEGARKQEYSLLGIKPKQEAGMAGGSSLILIFLGGSGVCCQNLEVCLPETYANFT